MTIVQCIWSGLPNIGRKGVNGPKIFKSGSADQAHRVFYFEVTYAPSSSMYMVRLIKRAKWNHFRYRHSISPVPGLKMFEKIFVPLIFLALVLGPLIYIDTHFSFAEDLRELFLGDFMHFSSKKSKFFAIFHHFVILVIFTRYYLG